MGTKIAILGYGAQGSAHAKNMRDEGLDIVIGTRKGNSFDNAISDGFNVTSLTEAASNAELIVVGLPDGSHEEILCTKIFPNAKFNSVIGFLHGSSIYFSKIKIPSKFGIGLLAPKGPGDTLRKTYLNGQGIPALFSVYQDNPQKNTKDILFSWGHAIGCSRAALIETTFKDESIIDLFGEQAVLCGGIKLLIERSFLLLVNRGYPPEIAYQECCQEIKQVTDLIFTKGLTGMLNHISTTAAFGTSAIESIAKKPLDIAFEKILDEIESGEFIQKFNEDYKNKSELLNNIKNSVPKSLENSGKKVRDWTPWLFKENIE